MTQLLKLLASSFIALFMLTACGTADTDDQKTSGSTPADTSQAGEADVKDDPVAQEEEDEPEKNEDTADTEAPATETNDGQSLHYKIDGEEKTGTPVMAESDTQPYSILVLPEFEFTGEEPNKDILYVKEDDHVFMRIEQLPAEISEESAIDTIKEQLSAVNSEIAEDEAPADNDWLKDAKIFSTEKDGELVKGYLIKNSNGHLKLTLFEKTDKKYEDAFLKMAETIKVK